MSQKKNKGTFYSEKSHKLHEFLPCELYVLSCLNCPQGLQRCHIKVDDAGVCLILSRFLDPRSSPSLSVLLPLETQSPDPTPKTSCDLDILCSVPYFSF